MTTRKDEIDEEMKSQAPPPLEDAPATPQKLLQAAIEKVKDETPEPTKMTLQSAEQFVQQAQEPQLASIIDSMLDSIQKTTGSNDRQMLRGYALVLRSIATSMPWDEDEGLDARRVHIETKTALPSWRDCIGALLQLEFGPPVEPEETKDDVAPE